MAKDDCFSIIKKSAAGSTHVVVIDIPIGKTQKVRTEDAEN
jgi:thymidine phosphorylase